MFHFHLHSGAIITTALASSLPLSASVVAVVAPVKKLPIFAELLCFTFIKPPRHTMEVVPRNSKNHYYNKGDSLTNRYGNYYYCATEHHSDELYNIVYSVLLDHRNCSFESDNELLLFNNLIAWKFARVWLSPLLLFFYTPRPCPSRFLAYLCCCLAMPNTLSPRDVDNILCKLIRIMVIYSLLFIQPNRFSYSSVARRNNETVGRGEEFGVRPNPELHLQIPV